MQHLNRDSKTKHSKNLGICFVAVSRGPFPWLQAADFQATYILGPPDMPSSTDFVLSLRKELSLYTDLYRDADFRALQQMLDLADGNPLALQLLTQDAARKKLSPE